MVASYLTGMGVAAVVIVIWFGVQQMSRAFHARHPEALPALETMGCHHCASAKDCSHTGGEDANCSLQGKGEEPA